MEILLQFGNAVCQPHGAWKQEVRSVQDTLSSLLVFIQPMKSLLKGRKV